MALRLQLDALAVQQVNCCAQQVQAQQLLVQQMQRLVEMVGTQMSHVGLLVDTVEELREAGRGATAAEGCSCSAAWV